jgi:hypothetical protein
VHDDHAHASLIGVVHGAFTWSVHGDFPYFSMAYAVMSAHRSPTVHQCGER